MLQENISGRATAPVQTQIQKSRSRGRCATETQWQTSRRAGTDLRNVVVKQMPQVAAIASKDLVRKKENAVTAAEKAAEGAAAPDATKKQPRSPSGSP